MTTIFGGNRSSGYDVDNSLRGTRGDSNYLSRTFSTGNRDQWTWSAWVKKNSNGNVIALFSSWADSNNNSVLNFTDEDTLQYKDKAAGSTQAQLTTNRKFKDPAAWYHIVLTYDSGNGTAGNRIRLYINGVEETSLATDTMPGQNNDSTVNRNCAHYIGTDDNSGYYLDCYLAEVRFVDGSALDPTSFGEFDSDSPTIWKPINVSGLTNGTNGFYLEFKQSGTSQNSSGLGADTSGEDHHFAVTNFAATDQSTDTCTNNFCVMNPILGALYTPNFTQGNLQVAQSNNNQHAVTHGTFAVTKGVWYWEVKYIGNTGSSGPSDRAVGIQTPNVSDVFHAAPYNQTGSITYYGYDGGEVWDEGTATTADYGTYSQNSILGISLDMDNGVISFYIDGNEVVDNYALGPNVSSATPAITWPNGTASGTEMGLNFGSPFFALSSAVADANGYGAFEYTPVGYALCTKNLAEFG